MEGRATQMEIAKTVGVSQPTVGRWLKGTVPQGVELFKLAEMFNVSMNEMLGGEAAVVSRALHESPPEFVMDDLLEEVQRLKEQVNAVERAARRLKKKQP